MASTDFLPASFPNSAKFCFIACLAVAIMSFSGLAFALPDLTSETEQALDSAIQENAGNPDPAAEFAQLSEQWSQSPDGTMSSTSSPGSTGPNPALVPNETFESYDSARGAILGLLKMTKERVAVITPAFLDGDLATTLHSLKLSQKTVVIVIDNRGRNRYNSRHQYLQSANIPVYFTDTKNVLAKNSSLIVIDNVTLAFGAPQDPDWRKSVSIRPGNQTPAELFAAINAKGPLLKVGPKAQASERQRARLGTGAKPSTKQKDSIPTFDGTIDDRIRLRARPIESKSSEIPRSLPKNTRMKEILSGSGASEEPVKPVRLLREDTLRLNSEGELRAD